MTSLNISHALELMLYAVLVGSMSFWGWRVFGKLVKKEKAAGQSCFLVLLSRCALAYGLLSIGVVLTLLSLIVMERTGMDESAAPIVEALAYFEVDLAC